jgi:DNA (cytosine-5)-methyltransferase 1
MEKAQICYGTTKMKALQILRTDKVARKLERLAKGQVPRVLDLFSGCGGLMLGFHRAGCSSIGGIDIDSTASLSYALNFHAGESSASLKIHASSKDLTKLHPLDLMANLGYKEDDEAVDILVGGPPCPSFTRIGRAKLREVQAHPEAFRQDPRSQLYLPYLRYATELAPVAVLMENVPDFLNWGGHNLAEEICEILEDLGYICAYTLLNAANHGVPQMRERMFLMAIHELVGQVPSFPTPTRLVKFPTGYEGSRDVALKNLRTLPLFRHQTRYVAPPPAPKNAADPVTVEQAIGDLPPITAHLEGRDRRGARRFDKATNYRDLRPISDYMREMREWPGFEGDGLIWDHVTRCLSDRDYRIFQIMQPGDEYPKAFALAEALFEGELARLGRRGERPGPRTAAYRELRSAFVPPYDPTKFPNKWRKMERDKPARTLMAHLGKDSYTHIHYDSAQARVLSVREAARLQSFPDGFRFSGTMNPAFRQIGNAVPPLLAFSIANKILESIGAVLGSPNSSWLTGVCHA